MIRMIFFGLASAATMLTTSCLGMTAEPVTNAPAGDNRPPASVATYTLEERTPEPASAPTTTDDGVEELGATYLWADGLAVTVSKPSGYKPSEYAAGADGVSKFVVFDITIVNNTGTVWDPALFQATVQSANQEASKVYDFENLPDTPSTKLLNGREATFKMAFGVADPADLVVEVTPDWEHQSVLFQD